MKNSRVHLLISGDVTGVGYRYWAYINAKKLGLTGFVRNVENGLVEAVIEGDEARVKEMIELCKNGPEVSLVKKIDIFWLEANGDFLNFEIRL